jgi:hypothetical protein
MSVKKTVATISAFLAAAGLAQASLVLITPVSATSSTAGDDLWPASNLVQGPGVGYDAADPYNQATDVAGTRWVTAAPGGFPSDYIAVAGGPVIVFDLGADTLMSSVHTWGYSDTNTNGVSEFALRFASDADGTGGFGTSLGFNPTFTMVQDAVSMQSNDFGQSLTARYVEFTVTDNLFFPPGDGSAGGQAGGDRAGLGEVAFGIPEPSAALLGLLGFGLMLRRRR